MCEIRRAHPAWGGRKIRNRLLHLGQSRVPAAATITGILRRHGLIGHDTAPRRNYVRFEAAAANDLWQMDHKGWFMTGTGRCDPFDVLDDHSRFNLVLDASEDQAVVTVQRLLEGAFSTYGLPRRILCDNGAPWGNTQSGFRWTGLSVWLLDLGVAVTHSGPRHPQTMGKDERFHRTLDLEVVSTRPQWDSHLQVQEAFDRWRLVYDHQRPHDALDGAVPAARHEPSARSMPSRIEPVDYPAGYHVRKVDSTVRITYQGNRYKIGKAFQGRYVGVVPTSNDGILNVAYRHQTIRTINLTQ